MIFFIKKGMVSVNMDYVISDICEISQIWRHYFETQYNKEIENRINIVAYVTGRKDRPESIDGIPVISYSNFAFFIIKV